MEVLELILFNIGTYEFKLHQLISVFLIAILGITIFRWLKLYLKPKVESWPSISDIHKTRLIKIIRLFIVMLAIIALIFILNINWNLGGNEENPIRLSFIFEGLVIIQFARLLDWIVSNYFIHRNFARRDEDKEKQDDKKKRDTEGLATKTVQYLVYVIALLLIIRNLKWDQTLFSLDLKDNQFNLNISNLLSALAIFLIGRLVIWVITQLFLYGYYRQKKIDTGAQFAVNQLVSYVGYFIVVILATSTLGLDMTLFWGGAAALLVGIGLGLQQTFNDFFSGIVLLFERTVKVGDIVQMDSLVGTVKKIGLRASILQSRDAMSVIVPNSKLVNQNVVNWSHMTEKVRFFISVGVAYGSDTKLVKKLLLEAVNATEGVLNYPPPFVRFNDFADSALNFELYYFSKELIIEMDIKSDLRFRIDGLFRDNKIKIPFPQSEIYLNQIKS